MNKQRTVDNVLLVLIQALLRKVEQLLRTEQLNEEEGLELLVRLQQLTIEGRLLYTNTEITGNKIKERLHAMGYYLRQGESYIQIQMPLLLLKHAPTTTFITEPLHELLDQMKPLRFQFCTAIFQHVFDSSSDDWRSLNCNSTEFYAVLEAIRLYCVAPGTGHFSSVLHTKAQGRGNKTIITLFEEEQLQERVWNGSE